MIPNYFLNELDRLLRDIEGIKKPFAGKIVILGLDFRQTLPVEPTLSGSEKASVSIRQSDLWNLFEIAHLEINMRVNPEEVSFTKWLERLGNGTLPRYQGLPNDSIRLPSESLIYKYQDLNRKSQTELEEDLISFTFGKPFVNDHSQCRAILCPLNEDTFRINNMIIDKVEGIKINKYRSLLINTKY